ncbi:hypothetical protein BDY19DRAFT_928203 [Irpex rosettiformis]|uniref:Uncharacterized protein n=1 Tax=Irpex rosettiformis TaxID=378272 RepID=A0ACB8UCV3_9APHY|nr:hypothetical protein BDY19DRAFT_928203 [Irpex rosettiformis]
MSLLNKLAFLFSLYSWFSVAVAVPSFDGVAFWNHDVGSLTYGMGSLEALGPNNNYENGHFVPRFLSLVGSRGMPGNVTVTNTKEPPLFYVHGSQLWHYHNSTTILPVNVRNSTVTSHLPLQLVVGNERDGVKSGSWRWQGTQLVYEQWKTTNSGVYYSCQDTNGLMGLFLFTKPAPTPQGCAIFTIHSFIRDS